MDTHNRVVTSMGDFAVMKQKIIHCATQSFESFLIVINDGLVRGVCACHHKRGVINLVEEHVVQASVGKHDADIMQVRGSQRRKIVACAFVQQHNWRASGIVEAPAPSNLLRRRFLQPLGFLP